jgi:hypothetical protein
MAYFYVTLNATIQADSGGEAELVAQQIMNLVQSGFPLAVTEIDYDGPLHQTEEKKGTA